MHTNVHNVINDVLDLKKFSPSTHVNDVMTRLVESVINCNENTLSSIDPSTLERLRNISSTTESALETYWAQSIIGASNPVERLQDFPYVHNYSELTSRELELVKTTGLNITEAHRVLVIGSGPLPLTAYELHRQSGARVDHVDASSEAIKLCENLCKSLDMDCNYYQANGQDVATSHTYDLILIAALAGVSQGDKQAIIDNILPYLSPEGRVIIRSASGNRQILYPALDPHGFTGISLLEEHNPTDHIINSVLVYGRYL